MLLARIIRMLHIRCRFLRMLFAAALPMICTAVTRTMRAATEAMKKDYPAKKHLMRHGKGRGRHDSATIKPDHTIHERPHVIENRERLGDLEGDTVCGKAGKGRVVTLADRKSRMLYAEKCESHSSAAVKKALGTITVRSIMLDNGSEFARHREIEAHYNAPVFFADPRTPW
jgi:IS30 family transposase